MSEISCQVRKILNPDIPTVTVGERFMLTCEALELPQTGELNIQVPENFKFAIKVDKAIRLDTKQIELSAYSALVGKHKIEGLTINGISITPIELEALSVQDPQNPVQEPYGPQVVGAGYPPTWSVVAFVFTVLFGLSLMIWPIFKKRRDKNQYAHFLSQCRTDLSPLDEFYREMREVKKSPAVWDQSLNKSHNSELQILLGRFVLSFEKLIGRSFECPFTEWSQAAKLKKIQTIGGLDSVAAKELQKFWFELERNRQRQLIGEDLNYLIDWAQKLAPEINLLKRLNG